MVKKPSLLPFVLKDFLLKLKHLKERQMQKWSQSMESLIREHLGFFEAKRHTLAEVIDRYLEDPSINIKTKENTTLASLVEE